MTTSTQSDTERAAVVAKGLTKAISVRAPWWWAIIHLGKDIENRDWPTKFRGRVLLHASKWWNMGDIEDDVATVSHIYRQQGGEPCDTGLTYGQMKDAGGCIVGSVVIDNCVGRSPSPWFFGRYGFVLRDPIAFAEPIPCKGALGFFTPDDAVLIAVRNHIKETEHD